MRIRQAVFLFTLGVSSILAFGQQPSAPEPQTGSIIGTVTDIQDDSIPQATVTITGSTPADQATVTSNDNGFFIIKDLHPSVPYHLSISAKGFAVWTSPEIVLKPGQQFDMAGIKLQISVVETTVTALTPEQVATEQVRVAEKQRILGFIPNFYVVYDHNFAPLTPKLKFQMAWKAETDVVTIAGVAFLAAVDQAADTPDYQQGWKGYGQRFGANYTDGFTDIMIGGAILPSLLHQDPRYFYQGTGTTKSRLMHALSAPFIAKGDNGKWQPNYSSIGGDLASGAISNAYYPDSNRGVGLVFANAAVTTAGRMANAVVQEFILKKFTPSANKQPQP
jgi:hypothetical protein